MGKNTIALHPVLIEYAEYLDNGSFEKIEEFFNRSDAKELFNFENIDQNCNGFFLISKIMNVNTDEKIKDFLSNKLFEFLNDSYIEKDRQSLYTFMFTEAALKGNIYYLEKLIHKTNTFKSMMKECALLGCKYNVVNTIDFYLKHSKSRIQDGLIYCLKDSINCMLSSFGGKSVVSFILNHKDFEKTLPILNKSPQIFNNVFSKNIGLVKVFLENKTTSAIIFKDEIKTEKLLNLLIKNYVELVVDENPVNLLFLDEKIEADVLYGLMNMPTKKIKELKKIASKSEFLMPYLNTIDSKNNLEEKLIKNKESYLKRKI